MGGTGEMRHVGGLRATALAVVLTGCGEIRDDGHGSGAAATAVGDSGDDSDGSDIGSASAADVDSGGTKLDVGADTGASADDGGSADECTNVDIVFVIDDSSSMGDNQASLVASFPGFVDGIEQNLELAPSVHIGVVTSDDYGFAAPGCQSIGDLVTQTGGFDSSAAVCGPFASGGNYLDLSEPDLAGAFACAAQVGSQGDDDERMMRGLLDALRPEVNDPASGACNAGFARDDSLLVIVLISDEDDVPEPYMCDPADPFGNPCDTVGSGGSPDAWKAELAMYKSNLDTNVVVLALVGLAGDNPCGAVPASKLIGFANRFGANGYTDDVCAASYDAFFAAALPIIDQACNDYVPPG
ncbi:MAG: VWA domain-containing protein [Nannocystaceae bacterium]|nr:VWA domain-containing protein [Nannocystaceae bacterium]